MPGKIICFPPANYGLHPPSCKGQVAKTAAHTFFCLHARGMTLSWAMLPSWPALTKPPLPVRSHSKFGTFLACSHFLCVSFSPARCSHIPVTDGTNQDTRVLSFSLAWAPPGCLGNASAPVPLPLFFFFHSFSGLFLLQTGDAPGFLAAFHVGELFYTQLKWRDVCIVPGKCKFLQKSYKSRRGFTTDMEMRWPAATSSPSLVSEILFLAKKKEYIFQISL